MKIGNGRIINRLTGLVCCLVMVLGMLCYSIPAKAATSSEIDYDYSDAPDIEKILQYAAKNNYDYIVTKDTEITRYLYSACGCDVVGYKDNNIIFRIPRWVMTQYSDASGNQAMFYTLKNMKDGTFIVIDGGWKENEEQVRNVIKKNGGIVDTWILTHYHNDHIDAFNNIYSDPRGIEIKMVYDTMIDEKLYYSVAESWDNIEGFKKYHLITDGKKNICHIKRNEILRYDDLKITFFNCYDEYVKDTPNVLNDASLMFKVETDEDSVLFCADCNSKQLSEMLAKMYGEKLQAKYVQLGHHGNNSFSMDFYDIVQPERAFFDAPGWLMSGDKYTAKALAEKFKENGIGVYDYSTSPNVIGLYSSTSGTSYYIDTNDYTDEQISVYNGVDYSAVYDYGYYVKKYKDIYKAFGSNYRAALAHFVNYGMKEGRQGSAGFNLTSYKNAYADLRLAFGYDNQKYYSHYINYGKKEGRTAVGTTQMKNPITKMNGIDYSLVYDYNYYINKYPDIKKAYGNDDIAVLKHFVNYGMKEGRQACSNFNVMSYAYKYSDLRKAYKNDLKKYYMHYINYGKKEGRTAVGTTSIQNCVTVYNGKDYSAVYNGTYYASKYSDIRKAYGLDDAAMLRHFIYYGTKEGRQGVATFNVINYKNRYADLRKAYGNNLKSYYMHYVNYGKREGRNAN